MKTEVYTCDICKNSKSKDDLAKLSISVEGLHIKGVNSYSKLNIDVCPECLRKKGFVVEVKDNVDELEKDSNKNKVTLEDKIYEILSDMGVVFEE